MSDRAYGYAGFFLALYKLLRTFEDVDQNVREKVKILANDIYTLQILMIDSAVGFNISVLIDTCNFCRDNWLQLCALAGIVEIPISVHMLFHFPQMILRFGAPLLYSFIRKKAIILA